MGNLGNLGKMGKMGNLGNLGKMGKMGNLAFYFYPLVGGNFQKIFEVPSLTRASVAGVAPCGKPDKGLQDL